MKLSTIFFILLFNFSNSQIIKDSILGKPKYVKEYVIFLNNSGPFTFMEGDDEYGHAVIMTPQNLRNNMARSWFESDFCRYINNETNYDINRNIISETWNYKSGRTVGSYNYNYDYLGRLIYEKSTNNYSTSHKKYIYEGLSKKIKFTEYQSQWENEPARTYFNSRENRNPFIISKFDSLPKTDSIFTVTDFVWKKVGENSFQEGKDSIFRKKLTLVNFYNDNFQIKESKFFDYKLDYANKKLFQSGNTIYEYDSLGRIKRETNISDDKYHYFTLEKNGKYSEEIKDGGFASTSSTEYLYYDNGAIWIKTYYYQGNISNQFRFEYKNNLIEKLYYLDTWGKEKDNLKPTIITFKYKFDKQKNWTECVKNVNGKDLYVWKREIKYY